jgi:hypothetical protein
MTTDIELQFLWRFMSTGLDGIAYQFMHTLNGPGGNGKTTICMFLKGVLGANYYTCPKKEMLMNDSIKANSVSPDHEE